MRIPLVDLHRQYVSLKSEIDSAISAVIEQSGYIGTPGNRFRLDFEASFASFINAKHCVGCANGTDSLELLLKAFGVGPGDEVIVPANTESLEKKLQ